MTRLLAICSIALLLTACGSDDAANDPSFPRTLNLGDNYQATFNMSEVQNGIADITINIESTDGSPLPDNEQVSMTPVMDMTSGMTHGTPMLQTSGHLDVDNTFITTAYFLMPSGPETGDWHLTVKYDGEMETFSVDVDMSMSDRHLLKGSLAHDKIKDMDGNDTPRPYFIFNEGRHVSDSMNSFTVYVAARETMMKHTSLIDDITLSGEMAMTMEPMSSASMTSREMAMPTDDYDLVIAEDGVIVEMCTTDCDASVWKIAAPVANKPGQYKANDLGLTGDSADIINVRLSVNGEIKAKGDSTTYATFDYSEGSSDTDSMNHSGM